MSKISIHVKNQLPSHIVNEYENFTKFIIYYYEYMEQSGNAVDLNFNFLKNISTETEIEDFYKQVARKFASGLPFSKTVDNKILVENIIKFYNSKGTEESYSFIMNMLFGESPSEYYLPKSNVLNLSSDKSTLSSGNFLFDGEYYQKHSYTLFLSPTLFENVKENSEIIKSLIHPIGKRIFIRNTDTGVIEAL